MEVRLLLNLTEAEGSHFSLDPLEVADTVKETLAEYFAEVEVVILANA